MNKTKKSKTKVELLTQEEKNMLGTIALLSARFTNLITDENRLAYAGLHLTALENTIMSQAAARAYPDLYVVL